MRVLMDYRPALRERTGVGEYTHQLAVALATRCHGADPSAALHLALFSSSWKDRLEPATVDPQLRQTTIVDRRVPVSVLNFAWHRLGWPPAELLTGAAWDVTHSSHPLLLPARRAAQVITIHDLNFLSHPERTRAEIRRDYPVLVRAHAARADRIIVPSQFTAAEVSRQLDVDAERIAICPPGHPDWARRAAPATNGYILFLGTLEPRKNVGGLLDAYEQLLGSPHASRLPELILAGKATAESRATLDRVGRPPLAGRVRHIGYVQPADRRNLYEGARMLVQPSFDEGFGLPVLEAMTIGVPVVAANRGALPEVLGPAGPLVAPDRPVEMANAIVKLLTVAAYEEQCIVRGLARSREFSWDRTAHIVFDMYRGAIAHRAARAAGRR